MKSIPLTIFQVLLASCVSGQVLFSPVDSKVKTVENNDSTVLLCQSSTMSVGFQLKHDVRILEQSNFVTIDTQIVQIRPLKFSGYKKSAGNLNIDDQRDLLEIYSKYELNYFKNDLKVDLIDPQNQWVVTKSKGWYIWYFKVGNIPAQVDKPTNIQLFASTVIGDKILTLNAPVESGGDFAKAGTIINDMMEALTIKR